MTNTFTTLIKHIVICGQLLESQVQ